MRRYKNVLERIVKRYIVVKGRWRGRGREVFVGKRLRDGFFRLGMFWLY